MIDEDDIDDDEVEEEEEEEEDDERPHDLCFQNCKLHEISHEVVGVMNQVVGWDILHHPVSLSPGRTVTTCD